MVNVISISQVTADKRGRAHLKKLITNWVEENLSKMRSISEIKACKKIVMISKDAILISPVRFLI